MFKECRVISHPIYRKRYASLITGGLPVELLREIVDILSAKDITNLSSTCWHARSVIKTHAKATSTPIVKRETQRLSKAANYMDFASLSFVTAWHRYFDHFGLELDGYDEQDPWPPQHQFVNAYRAANKSSQQEAEDGNNEDDEEDESNLLAAGGVILSISEWLQFFDRGLGLARSELADVREVYSWDAALAAAAGYTDEEMPGRYGGLIGAFQDDLGITLDPLFIIQAFEEVKARPLEDPDSFFQNFYEGSDESLSQEELHAIVQSAIDAVLGNPERGALAAEYTDHDFRSDLRRVQRGIGLPTDINGLHVFFWACNPRAKKLMEKISRDSEGEDGMLLAALLSELDVFFR